MYWMYFVSTTNEAVTQLITLVENLRDAKYGCPWDLKQNHHTLIPFLLEESYEVVDAVEKGDTNNLKEELGDVLFQVVLHSQLAQETKKFTFAEVVEGLVEKMLRRHPHVFPDGTLGSFGTPCDLPPAEIQQQWQRIKRIEKQESPPSKKLLDSVSASLPPMKKAVKLQHTAAKVGFDWSEVSSVFSKIREELDELEEAIAEQDQRHIEEELGDMLFVMANLARHLNIDPENALSGTNSKFYRRFGRIEELLHEQGKKLQECNLEQLDKYWEQAKQEGL